MHWYFPVDGTMNKIAITVSLVSWSALRFLVAAEGKSQTSFVFALVGSLLSNAVVEFVRHKPRKCCAQCFASVIYRQAEIHVVTVMSSQ